MAQEKNYTTHLIIGIFSSLLLFSCGGEGDVEPSSYQSYIYNNNSDYPLSITKWDLDTFNIYNLNPNENLQFEIELTSGACSKNSSRNCPLIFSDSLKVEFEDGKSLFFLPQDTRDISLYLIDNYQESSIANKVTHTYEFTEKDYQAAE